MRTMGTDSVVLWLEMSKELYGIVWIAEVGGWNGITIVRGKGEAKKRADATGWKYTMIGPLTEGKEVSFWSGAGK